LSTVYCSTSLLSTVALLQTVWSCLTLARSLRRQLTGAERTVHACRAGPSIPLRTGHDLGGCLAAAAAVACRRAAAVAPRRRVAAAR
ncbi:MAG: hypothetical protein ACK55Z_30385, partial [bacterium]